MSDIYYVRRGKTEYRWDRGQNDEWCCTVDHGDYVACLTVTYLKKVEIWMSHCVITICDGYPRFKQQVYDEDKYDVMERAINFMRRGMNWSDNDSDDEELRCALSRLRAQERSVMDE